MNSNHTTKSTEELKKQVLSDIHKVRDDIKEIKNRVTPGQIIDDAIFSKRGAVSPAQTFAYLRQNPVGTTFLTLGTLLLMEDSEHKSYESAAKDKFSEAFSEAKAKVTNAKESIKSVKSTIQSKSSHMDRSIESNAEFIGGLDTSPYGVESAKQGIEDLKVSSKEGLEKARSKLSSAAQTAKVGVQEGVDQVKSKLEAIGDNVKSKGEELYESARELDPLTYLALGVGLGTLTGAALPVTELESRVLDQRLEKKMDEFRQDLASAVNECANIMKNEFISDLADFDLKLFS